MQGHGYIGSRIAVQRKLRGLTQHQLADRAHISVSLLRKAEQGSRPVTHHLVSVVAAALGTDCNELTGQPYRSRDRRLGATHDLVPGIRRELVAYRLPPEDDQDVPPLASVRTQVAAVSAARHKADLRKLGTLLPPTLADLRAAGWGAEGAKREELMGLAAETYWNAGLFLHTLGHRDLASVVADRYEWAAEQSGDPLALALARVFRANELDFVANSRAARGVMERALECVEPPRDGDCDALSVKGWLHLNAAYISAKAGDSDDTWNHYAEAWDFASRLGHDGDAYRTAFGPTNVAIWGTALGTELMDGPKAVELAENVHLTRHVPAQRAGHHFIDLARAQLMNGDQAGAVDSLTTARRIAPQQTRYHPMARETIHALARAGRRSSESLRGMAMWMGVPD
jgi:transcriptional regulator with XRE-family HTH domain